VFIPDQPNLSTLPGDKTKEGTTPESIHATNSWPLNAGPMPKHWPPYELDFGPWLKWRVKRETAVAFHPFNYNHPGFN
jgi:hypothetical protein